MDLAINPADAAIAQRDWFREGALPDVFVDGRPGQAGRIDYFFQTDDSHEQAPLWLRGCAVGVKNDLNLILWPSQQAKAVALINRNFSLFLIQTTNTREGIVDNQAIDVGYRGAPH